MSPLPTRRPRSFSPGGDRLAGREQGQPPSDPRETLLPREKGPSGLRLLHRDPAPSQVLAEEVPGGLRLGQRGVDTRVSARPCPQAGR